MCEESRTTWAAAASWWGWGWCNATQRRMEPNETKRMGISDAKAAVGGLVQQYRKKFGAHGFQKKRKKENPCDPAVSNTVSRTVASSRKNTATRVVKKR